MAHWSGTDGRKLPAQQVEPYRLWFEFLKLAIQDPDIEVNRSIYEPWGDVENLTFDRWWSQHWRQLFAVDVGVYEVQPADARAVLRSIEQDQDGILIRIPLYQDLKRSLAQVEALLAAPERDARPSSLLRNMPAGQFHLVVGEGNDGDLIHPSTKFLRNLPNVRLLLNLYRFWVSHADLGKTDRIERTTLSYFAWADGWNRKVKQKNWKRPLIRVPDSVRDYHTYLTFRGNERKQVKLYQRPITLPDQTNARRQVDRYLTKARRLATNVGSGVFPGKYESAAGAGAE